jgi:hypothetical protein
MRMTEKEARAEAAKLREERRAEQIAMVRRFIRMRPDTTLTEICKECKVSRAVAKAIYSEVHRAE